MNILTGNDLRSGDVIWWTGNGWSRLVDDAVPLDEATADKGAADKGAALIAAEQAALRVVGAYVIAAKRVDGHVVPAHIKERVRALGPTVRLDLSLRPGDPTAAAFVA